MNTPLLINAGSGRTYNALGDTVQFHLIGVGIYGDFRVRELAIP